MVPVCSKRNWDGFATSFAAVGPPLRPSIEDVRCFEEAVANWTVSHPGQSIRALLLGVTREIAEMRWPRASYLLALDQSLAMAQTIWPGNIPAWRWAVCGDWLALPRREASCEVVIGDGSANCVRYPHGLRALAENVRSVLRDDGVLILRCFAQPASKETPEQVFSDMFRSRIPSFHHFKFRLLMAMQPSAEQGIPVNDVYRKWVSSNIEQDWLMSRTGWENRAIETIHAYRDREVVHTFPTLAELRGVLLEFFDEISSSTPAYFLGERCPRFVLTPRSRHRPTFGVAGGTR